MLYKFYSLGVFLVLAENLSESFQDLRLSYEEIIRTLARSNVSEESYTRLLSLLGLNLDNTTAIVYEYNPASFYVS